ncbi:MAG TPA: Gfo/Idh/MocA family oxidoreductase [Verrucomicrobiae bacterium]|nr:Gfo/Idh/MocA family oxidoreductase [Verrucomicrobiae bacterium]
MKKYQRANDIKVGVVGYGGSYNMGKVHLEEMQKAGMTPTAVAEIDATRLAAAVRDFPGIETYPSLATMLRKSEVDLITIITPHNTHAPLALQALQAGRHVVCEKPMAIRTAECDAMIQAAKKNRVVLSTYHNRHWDGPIVNAVQQVGSGMIGEVVRVEAHMGSRSQPGEWWRTSKSISGGVLYDWGVHLLEYSLQLIRSEIVEVAGYAKRGYWAAHTKWKKDTNEDEAFATVRFKSGQWLTLLISALDSNPRRGFLEVTGTEGSYVLDWPFNECFRQEGNQTTTRRFKNLASEGWRYYQNLADHLTKGEKLVITAEWARRPIHILDLADRSAQKGMALRAKYG